jgi:integrase
LRKTLHAGLQRALELELIGHHPMVPLRRRLPNGKAPEAQALDVGATSALLDQVTGTYRPAVLLALACGLRRGEIVALRWHNVDLDAATVTITEATVPLTFSWLSCANIVSSWQNGCLPSASSLPTIIPSWRAKMVRPCIQLC